MKRSSGILAHISSLPSRYGIGTLGQEARRFVDFLQRAGQRYWQVLPIGPVSYGDSPYQSFSTFAGNPYFIDLESLCEEGLLRQEELDALPFGDDPGRVDYEALYRHRREALYRAYRRGWERDRAKMEQFAAKQGRWLSDYALFMACKERFGMRSFIEWEDEALRRHEPQAVREWAARLQDETQFWSYLQLLFYRQWAALRAYAAERGVGLIGDIPIYVAYDSADVWAAPEQFWLDEARRSVRVAGCPPDYFSEDGQLWGNPLYDWQRMASEGFAWWKRRVNGLSGLFDVVRIDHFRGFEAYYAIPAEDENARGGDWLPGPGLSLVEAIRAAAPQTQIIAEDLGLMTDGVRALLRESGLLGMKVLQFAFDSGAGNEYLPHNYPHNCVVYTGTHDNDTVRGWLAEAPAGTAAYCRAYLNFTDEAKGPWAFLRGAWASVADLSIAPVQELLGLRDARMNTPSTMGGNWSWRLLPGALTDELADQLAELTRLYGRG